MGCGGSCYVVTALREVRPFRIGHPLQLLQLLVCWRFAGAGFGDVRLAVLGGLGIVHPTHVGLVVAVAAFILITVTQATVTLARGGNRHTTFPYGTAIAGAFVVAAVV